MTDTRRKGVVDGLVVLSIILGFFTFVVADIADEIQGAGRNASPPATSLIVVLYLAVSQFLVAKKGVGLRANLPRLAGMVAPLFVMLFVLVLAEKRATVLNEGTWLLAGCVGTFVGAIGAAAWRTRRARGGLT
jgi:hypothetical protein